MASVPLVPIVSLCVVLACAETLHGIVRTVWLTPRLGKAGALKSSAVTGTLLALAVCYLLVPATRLSGPAALLALGFGLAAFMAMFDIAMGLFLLRKPLGRVLRDFDPRTGNWLSLGLAALVFIPALAAALRR